MLNKFGNSDVRHSLAHVNPCRVYYVCISIVADVVATVTMATKMFECWSSVTNFVLEPGG